MLYRAKLREGAYAYDQARGICLPIRMDMWTSLKDDKDAKATWEAYSILVDNLRKRVCVYYYGNCLGWRGITIDETEVDFIRG